MGRPAVFAIDTVLYHPIEGARTFPRGEQDPGGMWSESPGGDPLGGKTADAAVKELVEANDRIEQLGKIVAAKDHDLFVIAQERDAANARAAAAEQRIGELERMLASGETLPAQAPDSPEVNDKRTVETAAERAAVTVPADWRDMKFFAQKALAAKLTDQPVNTKEDVIRVLEAAQG